MAARQVVTVETIASYARRTGDSVRLVMHLPDVQPGESTGGQIRLNSKRGSAKGAATVTAASPGVRVEMDLPAKRLPPAVWKMAIKLDPEAPFRRVQARLLTSRTQPIALLSGPPPATRMDPPVPHQSSRPRVLQQAGRVVDQALGVLPPERAGRYRASLRKSAHRIFG